MNIQFYSWGACREVTGSKHFLEIDRQVLQIDCGMFEGRREETYLKNRNLKYDPSRTSAVLLTHAHFDHCGALPIAIKNGFDGNIYSTSATRDVTNIILLDAAYIQSKDSEYIKEQMEKHPERGLIHYPPLYTPEDAVSAMEHFVTVNYHRPFSPLPQVEARFSNSGHILGSALIALKIGNQLTIGFSGDLGRKNLPIIKDPEYLTDLDYLVLEGTYGNRRHPSIGSAKEELCRIILKAHNRNGKIIIPSFTIERTQELIYFIHQLVLEKKIPPIPIFVDSPMAVNATAIFKIHPECFDNETIRQFTAVNIDPFGFDTIRYVASTQESIEINSLKGSAIIISASGMAESGRILHHLANHIENPNNIIAIVGYMAQHTLGRRLADRVPEVKIFGKIYALKAEVEILNAFSGHADYLEIKEWISQHDLKKLRRVFLVHGEDEALTYLRTELLDLGVPDIVIAEAGQSYRLD